MDQGRAPDTWNLLLWSFPGERRPRSTVIPDQSMPLKSMTLGAILSVKQTGLGRVGLQALLEKYS